MTSMRHILTILPVDDLAKSRAFYDRAFGWEVTKDGPVYVEYELPGGQRVGLYERSSFARSAGRAPSRPAPGEVAPVELYLHCDNAEDLAANIVRLLDAGAEMLSPLAPRLWGDEVAYFADPGGTVLALSRPLPDHGD